MLHQITFGSQLETTIESISAVGTFIIGTSTIAAKQPLLESSEISSYYSTFDTWGLYLNLGWRLDSPEVKTYYIDIPGGDGSLDLTEALAGEPRYKDRIFAFTCTSHLDYHEFISLFNTIKNTLHGLVMPIYPPHNSGNYLDGRIYVNDWVYYDTWGEINFSCHCKPWLYFPTLTTQTYSISSLQTISLTNTRKTAIPTLTTDSEISVSYNNTGRVLSPGTWLLSDMPLKAGISTLAIDYIGNTNPNLISGAGLSTPLSTTGYYARTEYFTPLSDGWGNFNFPAGDNVYYYFSLSPDAVPLAENTEYILFVEIRNWSSGSGGPTLYVLYNSDWNTPLNPNNTGSAISQNGDTLWNAITYSPVTGYLYSINMRAWILYDNPLSFDMRISLYENIGENSVPDGTDSANITISYQEAVL